MAADKDMVLGILGNIFRASSYDDPVVRHRALYLVLAVAAFILSAWAGIFKYLGWLFLLLFLVSVPLHYYERARMLRILKNRAMPGE